MKLDRNIPGHGGKGKYALLLLRALPAPDEQGYDAVQRALDVLEQNGVLDWGYTNTPAEFFLIRLRDRFAGDALRAYADAAKKYADSLFDKDHDGFMSMYAWAVEVLKLAGRAGDLSDHCKTPD